MSKSSNSLSRDCTKMKRWFFKTTDPIPVVVDVNMSLGTIDGTHYIIKTVSAGMNEDTGWIFINYDANSFSDLTFWIVHFHEFIHRIIWLLKWNSGHKILDMFDKKFWWASVVKDLRTGTTKVIKHT